jgi:lantibiotic biosynthesis protein
MGSTSDWQPSGFCVLRTPLLPLETLSDWGAPGGDQATAESAARERLRELVAGPEVAEALYLASGSVHAALAAWRDDPLGRKGRRVEHALVRYLFRMASRPTPFGLCAGYSVVPIAGATELAIEGRESYGKHVRLDAGTLVDLCQQLLVDDRIRAAVRYRANTSLVARGSELRFTRRSRRLDGGSEFELLTCDATDPVRAVLTGARGGATIGALVDLLTGEQRLADEEAGELMEELIEGGLLEPDLEIPVDGREPLDHLVSSLASIDPGKARILEGARDAMRLAGRQGVGAPVAAYEAIGASLGELSPVTDPARTFLVELTKPAARASVGRGVAERVLDGVELLRRICRTGDPLAGYRYRMRARFEAQSWEIRETIPLAEALDPEIGLEVGAGQVDEPLLRWLSLEAPAREDDQVPWGDRERFLLSVAMAAARSRVREVELDDDAIARLAMTLPPPLPDAFCAHLVLLPDGRIHLALVEGPSGIRSMGRFCHGDPALAELVRAHVRAEEAVRPGVVFAEVAHLPDPGAASVSTRPSFRDHVIAIHGLSTAPVERWIGVDELELALVDEGAGDGRLALVSRRLGTEVVPRLSVHPRYHDPDQLDLYRFLGSMQDHGTASRLAFDWGPIGDAPYLPRLCHRGLVLSLARWNLDRPTARLLSGAIGRRDHHALARLRAEQGWPRWVALDAPESPMLVDLDNPLSLAALASSLARGAPAAFVESLQAPGEAGPVTGPEGTFAHELAIPFVRTTARPTRPAVAGAARSRFPPGSRWLYCKLYGDPDRLDDVVRAHLPALALGQDGVDRFFFVRMVDPGAHLRLRFRGDPAVLAGRVRVETERLARDLIAAGGLERLQIDTYEPEIARYGGEQGLEVAEEIFTADSRFAVTALAELGGDREDRWRFALVSADRLLASFGLDLAGKLELVSRFAARIAQEFGESAERDRHVARMFRDQRAALERLLAGETELPGTIRAQLADLAAAISPLALRLRGLQAAGQLAAPPSELFRSLLHMHMNRLLVTAPRAQELVLYDFLARLYRSLVARA